MGPLVLLLAVSLLHLCQTKGSSTVTVFVQTGKDLLLEVKENVTLRKGDDVTWRFNGHQNIAKLSYRDREATVFTSHEERAEMSAQNYSLLLKNVQKKDSGEYKAHLSGNEVKRVAEYKVTVLNPVSPVKLTVNVSSSCNFTVTCSTVDSNISSTFTCDNQNCSQEGGERSEANTSTSSISVYLEQGLIICNHSNQISWKQDTKDKPYCAQTRVSNGANTIVTGVVSSVAGAIAVIGGIVLSRKYKKKSNGNTVYEVPQEICPTQPPFESPRDDASGLSPTSTYCLVQFHTGPAESTRTKNDPLPETVYAQVNRAAKTNCRSPEIRHPEQEVGQM